MRILLAVDGSPGSEAAVEEVCRRPWPPESEVRVVTVLSPIDYILMQEAAHSPVNFDDILEQQGMEAAKRLSEIADDLAQRAPGLHVTPRLLEGLPKEAIVDEAEQWSADLIVIGSNGYGSIKRFVLGSVSLAVALYAPCSVEIVRQLPIQSRSDLSSLDSDSPWQ